MVCVVGKIKNMKKGLVIAFTVIAAMLIYILVFSRDNKSYDPNTVRCVDTANMLGHYFHTVDTANHWIPKGTVFPDSVQMFNASGRINQKIKIWADVVTPNTSNGYSVDISSASFGTIISANATAIRNSGTITSAPYASIKTVSTTAIVLNIAEANPTLVTILGSGVPLGLPIQFANTSGLTVFVVITGY